MSARLAVRRRASALPGPYEDVPDGDVPDGVSLGAPLAGVPPEPLCPVSPVESVGDAGGLFEPVSVGVGDVSVGVGDGDVSVGVGVGDEVVGVGDGDVALTDGDTETLGETVGLAVADGVAAHDGDGVADADADGTRAADFLTAGVTEPATSAAFVYTSRLDQSTARVCGQLAEVVGLADAPRPELVVPPRPGVAP
jgi:hypothetical protein